MIYKMFAALCILFAFSAALRAQPGTLPVKEWKAPAPNPLVLYISGDGGLNSFTIALCEKMNRAGYYVIALNTRSYFWKRKTPQQSAADIYTFIENKFKARNNHRWIWVGYSFGADVSPFIINRLPAPVYSGLMSVVLLAPSPTTDFEIHLMDMLGSGKKRNMDVVAEINRMSNIKLTSLHGAGDKDFPKKNITLKNYHTETLPGSHNFDGATDAVFNAMQKYLK